MRDLAILLLLACASAEAAGPDRGEGAERAPDLPGEVMPDRHWDFQSLSLDLRIDPSDRSIAGTAVNVVRPLGRPEPWLRMHAVGLQIDAVAVDGAPVEGWRVGRDTLDVPVKIAPGERTVEVRYHAKPRGGLYFRGGKGSGDAVSEVWSQGEDVENRFWYPGWDYPNDRFAVREAWTVPAGWTAVGNGQLVGRSPQPDGTVRWEYRLDQDIPGYLVMLAAGDYRVVTDATGAVPLEHLAPRTFDEETIRRTAAPTTEILDFFAKLLDRPYPYPVYRQVFVQRFLYGGMENASATVMADGYLLPRDDLQRWDTDLVLAHEAAHQWFGDLIGCYGWRELWLNEGFATYYENRWQEHAIGPDGAAAEVEGWMDHGRHDGVPMAARGWSKVRGRAHAQVYARGGAVLHMLEAALGRDTFDAGIRRYVAENAGRQAESEDLRRALEEVSGEHLGWLFDRYVFAADFPDIRARSSWSDGELTVTFTSTDGPLAAGPVTVEVGTPTGPRRQEAWLDAGTVKLVMPLPDAPRYVAVDPDRALLADWDLEQEPSAWVAQLGSDAILARRTAIRELGDGKAADGVIEALSGILRSPSEAPQTRAAAAAALGRLGGADTLPALQAGAKTESALVRQASYAAIGDLVRQGGAVALARAGLRDRDPQVRDAALGALASLDPEAGAAEARRLLAGPSAARSVHPAALSVLGAHGETSDLPAMIRRISYGETRDTRHAAARAAADRLGDPDAEGAEKYRPLVTAALVGMLGDLDRLDTGLAIGLLGRVGDESALAPLRAFAARDTMMDPDLGASALDAAAAIRSRGKPEPERPEERADLARVRAELEDLEDRIERLEEWR